MAALRCVQQRGCSAVAASEQLLLLLPLLLYGRSVEACTLEEAPELDSAALGPEQQLWGLLGNEAASWECRSCEGSGAVKWTTVGTSAHSAKMRFTYHTRRS